MEAAGAALATIALPAFPLCDRCDLFLGNRDAEREMGWAIARPNRLGHGESSALRTGRTQLGAGRVDFDPGAVLIVLMGEPTARIGCEPRRRATHELCEHFGNVPRIARGDRQVMDHGIFVPVASLTAIPLA